MKSTIKIEFDFDTKEPYLEVKIQESDDLRDQMLKSYFQSIGEGNLLRVDFRNPINGYLGNNNHIVLKPIKEAIKIDDKPKSKLLFPLVDEDGYIAVIPELAIIPDSGRINIANAENVVMFDKE